MPWRCEQCGTESLDDKAACPSCGGGKRAWTLHPERTRTLVVPTPQLVVKRGERTEPLLASEVHLEDVVLLDTDEVRALPKARVAAQRRAGKRPAPRDVLFLLYGQGAASTKKVGVTVEYSLRSADARTYDFQRGGWWESRFVFVRGPDPEGWAEVAFPGLELVDVAEEGEPGHALTVEVGVGAKRKELKVVPAEDDTHALDVALVEDVLFGTDRCVLLPGAEGPDGAPAQGGLAALRSVLLACDLLPGRRVLVAGHTDTSGAADHNLALSTERARNVWLYLSGQRDAWAAHCAEQDAIDDVKRALRWVARTFGWATDPGAIDATWTEKARAARDEFRARYNAERGGALERGAKQGPADWAALADLYDEALRELLDVDAAGLAALRARLTPHDPPFVGLGERWPAAAKDGQHVAADRRVEVLLFDEADLPGALGDGAVIYGPGGYQRRPLPADPAELAGLRVEGGDGVAVGQWVELRATTPRPLEGTISWSAGADALRVATAAGPTTWVSGQLQADRAPVSCSITTPSGRTYRAAHALDVKPVAYEVAFQLEAGEALPREPKVLLRAEDGSYERELALDDPACTRRLTLGAVELHLVRFDGVLPGRRYACRAAGRTLFDGQWIDPEPQPGAGGEG